MRSKLLWTVLLAVLSAGLIQAQYPRPTLTQGVGIDQKLSSQVPLDLTFHDELGHSVALRKYFGDKPVILSMVYFTCPSLCPMSLHETVTQLGRVSLEPDRDYHVVVVSFNPADTPEAAAQAKAKYKIQFGNRPGFDEGWHFLTGGEANIKRITDAIGFRYRWDEKTRQFVHAGGIMVATPDGKMSRYFYGIDYAPADLRMALVEASQHKIGSPVDYVLLFCFHYDWAQGRYTLTIINVLKVAAALTVVLLAGLIFLLMRSDKNKKPIKTWKEAPHAR
ncbi:MAG: SCO family protein [Acidobacteriaceae bacterium]|nr:SCO family protein [Acidobacteriota bacterium]MBV8807151.1 SCO family protein [Acidobacteriaceae bacterium]MBV9501062.1 SCO family protein [Acidobacteriaceae bacterium]